MRSRRTRAALVAGVRDELRATGSFTAEAVAARAGCSPATFYSHFGTKDDALSAAFEQTLTELVDGSVRQLTVAAFSDAGVADTVTAFVEHQTRFFRRESLVFRTALGRLPAHRPLREAYRQAERAVLAHLADVFAQLDEAGVIVAPRPAELAEAFMVASQGLNNPRALQPSAAGVRASLARGLGAMLIAGGGDHDRA